MTLTRQCLLFGTDPKEGIDEVGFGGVRGGGVPVGEELAVLEIRAVNFDLGVGHCLAEYYSKILGPTLLTRQPHAAAGCIAKWHKIPKGKALTTEEQTHFVGVMPAGLPRVYRYRRKGNRRFLGFC